MEDSQRPQTATVAQNFDDLFKSVEDVNTAEPKTVEPTEAVTPQVTPEPIVEAPKAVSDYKKRIASYLEDGLIENFAVTVQGDNGEENVFLADLDIQDEETFKTILSNYKEAKSNEIKEKYIPVEGIDETTRQLIEIRKAGGDIQDIIKENVSAMDAWVSTKQNLTDNEQLQMNVVAWELKQKGLSDRVIEAQIKDYADNLQLDVEAEKIVNFHLASHRQEIEQKKQSQLQKIESEKEAQKQIRKNLSTTYKEWKLPDHLQKVLVDNSTKVDENNLTNTEKLFFEAQKNPEVLAEIAFLLNDRDGFKKWVSSKPVLQAQLNSAVKPLMSIDLKTTRQVKRDPVTVDERFDDIFQK
jgi:hypothetical protein